MLLMLQITAAQGPAECERAVSMTLRSMLEDAARQRVSLQLLEENATPAGFKSVRLRVQGEAADAWLRSWEGSVQCIFTSPFRPNHKRKNWFVGVERCALPQTHEQGGTQIEERDMLYQACRASGKGGQHVNTTDSAVHATHLPSGISVKVMTERSQHANKRLARALIAVKLAERVAQQQGAARRALSEQHWSLVRGSPVRVLR